jgi:hypothetical protein
MSGLPVFEAPKGVYEELVSKGKASFHSTNQEDNYQIDDNSIVGIRGEKSGDVIVCKIKVEQTGEKGILVSLKKT